MQVHFIWVGKGTAPRMKNQQPVKLHLLKIGTKSTETWIPFNNRNAHYDENCEIVMLRKQQFICTGYKFFGVHFPFPESYLRRILLSKSSLIQNFAYSIKYFERLKAGKKSDNSKVYRKMTSCQLQVSNCINMTRKAAELFITCTYI